MKIKIIENRDNEVTFATEIGSGIGFVSIEPQHGQELDVDLKIEGFLTWPDEIDYSPNTSNSIAIHSGQTEITAKVQSNEVDSPLVLRVDEGTVLTIDVKNLPEDLPIATHVTLRTDSLELIPQTSPPLQSVSTE